jgi:tyrosyl-tRNA synthetase
MIEKETPKLQILAGTEEVLPLSTLEKKLSERRPLIIKLGVDPTSANIHLGHAVVLEKLRDFQLLGHKIIFLIGDFTARIGDPTGKSKTRPTLTEAEIAINIHTYINQIKRILDISNMEIIYNSRWFDTFSSRDWMKLTSLVTVAQIIQREDFANRLNNNTPIGMHELLYPLLQGYDSIMLNADIEIGGTDQKFNMLMGRHLQEAYGLEGQVIITMPIIEGLDGSQKMSKSLHNDIGLIEKAQVAFIKIMSINDTLMIKYYIVLLRYSKEMAEAVIAQEGPIEAKKLLAKTIIAKYWSIPEAEEAYNYFSSVIQNKQYSIDTLEKLSIEPNKEYIIIDLIQYACSKLSRSEIRRLIKAGAVSIDGEKITDDKYNYTKTKPEEILKIGKQLLFVLVYNENN